jgi:aminopeptidase N
LGEEPALSGRGREFDLLVAIACSDIQSLRKFMNTFSIRLSVATRWLLALAICLSALGSADASRADDPFPRTRDYDLQNVRVHLRFETDNKKVIGEVTHSISILRPNVTELKFDSVALTIESVTLDGKTAKFETTADNLIVKLPQAAHPGEHMEVSIHYWGTPTKGLYWVLPDKDYPDRPREIWSQGESEDTRYYIPIYDYPNDRTTSEMLVTVPANWLTISNGRLAGVKTEADGTKTWDWKQTEPLSTYLISVVAGELVEKKDTWRGMAVEYVVPKGQESKIDTTFERTKKMLDAFSDRLGVRYPWAKYAQTSVDEFVVGGMENTSATTLTARALVNPALAAETLQGADSLDSHELAHQWFGDLVTCRDWADIWLNEGFATYMEHYWIEAGFSKDDAEYEFWTDSNRWAAQKRLFPNPIVSYDITNPIGNSGNIYGKGGLVLRMLREKLGDDAFFHALHHYLETNRGQNVVTADLIKAIEQDTSVSVDEFFRQWVYGAGAPKFEVTQKYDDAAKQLQLEVKQTQKVENYVGLFHVPIDVEVATAAGRKTFPIDVSKADETFSFTLDGAPLMVIFDAGNKILKTLDFKRDPGALIFELKNAETVPDRAEAASALGDVGENDDIVRALGTAAANDPFWGVRNESLRSLGKIGNSAAEKEVEAALANDKPWVREVAVTQLGKFKDASLGAELAKIAGTDPAYRVRAAALQSLADSKAPNALDVLTAAVKSDSPDDILRRGALRAFGDLGDDKAAPLVLEWSADGKPLTSRAAAISSLGLLDKGNKEITKALISYAEEGHRDVRFPAVLALGRRGDPAAIPTLEELAKAGGFGGSMIQGQIQAIRAAGSGNGGPGGRPGGSSDSQPSASDSGGDTAKTLERIQKQLDEVNSRLQKIESQIGSGKK